MAQVIRYVDPDAPGPTHDGTSWNDAYLTFAAWNTGEATDLDTANDYHTAYFRASAGTAETGTCVVSGWTTSATDYIELIQVDAPSDGIWDATAYRVALTNSQCLTISENYVRLIGFQVEATVTTNGYGIRISSINAGGSDIRIDSCIVKGVTSGTGEGRGIHASDPDATITIFNTIVYGFDADPSFTGIYTFAGPMNIYNCTLYGNYRAFYRDTSGTMTVTNCAIGNHTQDFLGTITVDYCCSDSETGTNSQAPSGGAWTNEFTDPANGDFSLLVGGNCVDNGTDDPSSGIYSDDIIDTARVSPWDIGAFEYTAGGGGDDGAGAVLLGTVF